MAVYENQSDMFAKRAEGNKKSGDQFYAQSLKAESKDERDKFMAQAKNQYKMQKENEEKAKIHNGKNF